MGDLVDARELKKSFDGIRAVDGVSLRVAPRERVAIIGPNGAGKTTTLLMLLGAIEADAGTIRVGDHDLPAQRHQAMRSVGFAAGYLPLPDRLKVHEALRFFADLSELAEPATAVGRAIDELDIGYIRDQLCMTLSSGQRTLVGIAKATLHQPRLLVLDEPTASLDPDIALRVRDRLAALNAEHHTALLMTSHDMREVQTLTERVVFLRAGAVIADGPPAAIAADAGQASLEALFLTEAARLRERRV
ncbi:MAG: ABC transporter ATP-binding protein [Acidimicrobiales bacterium]|nr:ABC transporter ATP-binding protein [Acidimicrobiales bacterium]